MAGRPKSVEKLLEKRRLVSKEYSLTILSMLRPDYPIDDKEKDLLRRWQPAKKIAEMIGKFEGKESFVVGIEGPWGAGKTSFINLILTELDQKDTIIIPFNPWSFSGQNELINDFFDSLAAGIEPFQTNKDNLKKLKSLSSKLTRKAEATFSPEISFWGVSVKATDIFKFGGNQKTLQEERKEIDAIFHSLKKKIVIVIDDIDRLDKEETRLIMKLVKMTANFPKTVFLLAYDRVHVTKRLAEDGWPGDEFLKKIVQVSFTLPEPDRDDMRKMLFNDLDSVIEELYGPFNLEKGDEKRWNQIVYAGFPSLFSTIRDIKRYASSLRLNWSIVSIDDVNVIDFLTIEAVRVFYPKFHSLIKNNKPFFLGTHGIFSQMAYRDNQQKRDKKFSDLLAEGGVESEDEKEMVKKVCEELFPQLESYSYAGDIQVEWRKQHRVCSDTNFDVYFQLGIPSGGISEVIIRDSIKLLDRKEGFSEELIRLNKEKLLRPMLGRITDRIDTLSERRLYNLVCALWGLDGKVQDDKTAVLDFDDLDSATHRITYHSLKNLSKENRKVFLEKLVKNNESIYYPVKIIRHIEEEVEQGKAEENLLLDSSSLNTAKKLVVKRIEEWAKDGRLIKVQSLPFILFVWKKWSGDTPVKKYISDLLETNRGVLSFIDGFVGITYSSNGNYKDISKKTIGELYPIDELEKKVAALTSEDLKKATKSEREAVNVFKNPPKRW